MKDQILYTLITRTLTEKVIFEIIYLIITLCIKLITIMWYCWVLIIGEDKLGRT